MTEKISKGVKIAPGAVVCVESEIRGDVTIGPRTVIHPKARIIAEAGPIVIGEGNLIEEQALILNGYPENIIPDMENMEPKSMIIGTNNVFEVGCYSEAMKMGDNNVIESKAPDPPAGFPDEDFAQLPPPQEDHKGEHSPCQELSWSLGGGGGRGGLATLALPPTPMAPLTAQLCPRQLLRPLHLPGGGRLRGSQSCFLRSCPRPLGSHVPPAMQPELAPGLAVPFPLCLPGTLGPLLVAGGQYRNKDAIRLIVSTCSPGASFFLHKHSPIPTM
uniref:Dynactin subunit 6 n=1 Tax=Monodelphis domestica TaxID=13616 RepID=A0A5F8H6C6_MONDO